MTNPVDDNTELENIDPAEDVCSADNDALLVTDEEEILPNEYDIKPKKKTLALEARHRIEELTQLKKIKDEFYYFDEDDFEFQPQSHPVLKSSKKKNIDKKKTAKD